MYFASMSASKSCVQSLVSSLKERQPAQQSLLCGHFTDRLQKIALRLVEAAHVMLLLMLQSSVLLLLLQLRLLLGLLLLHDVLLLALSPGLLVDFFHRPQLFLPFHPPILEPDLDLPFGEAKGVRDLYSSPSRQVWVEVELLLQLERLEPRVRLSTPAPRTTVRSWKRQERRFA